MSDKQKQTKTETRTQTVADAKVGGPRFKAVISGKEHDASMEDLGINSVEELAAMSDADLKASFATWLDVDVKTIGDHELARLTNGNVLLSPRAVFGN